jgi:hypothetical protein
MDVKSICNWLYFANVVGITASIAKAAKDEVEVRILNPGNKWSKENERSRPSN